MNYSAQQRLPKQSWGYKENGPKSGEAAAVLGCGAVAPYSTHRSLILPPLLPRIVACVATLESPIAMEGGDSHRRSGLVERKLVYCNEVCFFPIFLCYQFRGIVLEKDPMLSNLGESLLRCVASTATIADRRSKQRIQGAGKMLPASAYLALAWWHGRIAGKNTLHFKPFLMYNRCLTDFGILYGVQV